MTRRDKATAADHFGVCTCATLAGAESRTGGRVRNATAVTVPLTDANMRQLRRIEGQVRGTAAMVEDRRPCADILYQVAAVRRSLHTVARNLMRNHLSHCAAAANRRERAARDELVNKAPELVGKIA